MLTQLHLCLPRLQRPQQIYIEGTRKNAKPFLPTAPPQKMGSNSLYKY